MTVWMDHNLAEESIRWSRSPTNGWFGIFDLSGNDMKNLVGMVVLLYYSIYVSRSNKRSRLITLFFERRSFDDGSYNRDIESFKRRSGRLNNIVGSRIPFIDDNLKGFGLKMCCEGSLGEVSRDRRSTSAIHPLIYTALQNCSAICRLLLFTADLILSFRAQHT
ncbi:hypothetical protein H5410_028207 [Solanum commersonii]|uniref:Uncharacterized protein n=1 Tax=Solanum commersonii TaxID=4109 RepID=A0A9J5Z198_SOLCO|nr:hypothetical protein H5410_028207 [Solanum commersonii]